MKLVFSHLTHPLNRTKVTNRYLQCKGKPTACNITLSTAAKLISHFLKTLLNLNVMQFYLFQPNVPFQYSLKTPERLWFYDVFRGYKNGRLCVKVSWYSQNYHSGFSTCQCPLGNYLFKIINRNTRARCEICSKFMIKTPERQHCSRSGVFTVNFEHISQFVLVFLL